ncbi:hypothetical protein GCM10023335_68280 [Streptomyces siamensis]|uniref:Uncharacterized protein n=1 Tax=Streptomyces siamensis TaxID=1274986 RepID=A0ABP9JE91_9ACTN
MTARQQLIERRATAAVAGKMPVERPWQGRMLPGGEVTASRAFAAGSAPHIIRLRAVQVAVACVGARLSPRHSPGKSAKVPDIGVRHQVVDVQTARGR